MPAARFPRALLRAAAARVARSLTVGRDPFRSPVPLAVESLESRRLLSFQAALNFGPDGSPAVDGYSNVSLGVYPTVVDGMTLGWSGTGPTAVRRTGGAAPDERFRSYARPYSYTLGSARKFEVALPNGTYRVRAVAGTPDEYAGNGVLRQRFLAENVAIVDGTTSAAAPFVAGVANVAVTDGRLTITVDSSVAPNARLAFLDIVDAGRTGVVPAAPGAVAAVAGSPTSVDLTWADNADNEGRDPATITQGNLGEIDRGYQVERRRQLADGTWDAWAIAGYALANATRFSDVGLSSGVTYGYRVSAINAAGASAAVAAGGNVGTPVPGTGVQSQVTFGTEARKAIQGYFNDFGEAYGTRRTGETFGWLDARNGTPVSNRAATSDDGGGSDQRRQQAIAFGNKAWEMVVPNGTYWVKLVAGDANVTSGTYGYDVEGSAFLRGTAGADGARWITAETTINVTDGRLTITWPAGMANDALTYVEVTTNLSRSQSATAAPTDVVITSAGDNVTDVRWTDHSDNEEGFKVERGTSATGPWTLVKQTYANVGTYGDNSGDDGATYYYRVTAFRRDGAGTASAGVVSNVLTTPDAANRHSRSPYNPTRVAWNGTSTIQAEDYDVSGSGTAYNDTTNGNAGGYYRTGSGDVGYNTPNARYFVGWTKQGEWNEYTINLAESGRYTFEMSVASPAVGGKFNVLVNNATKWSNLSVPSTGSFATYQTITTGQQTLTAGTNLVVRVLAIADDPTNHDWVADVDWFRLVKVGSQATPTASITASQPSSVAEDSGTAVTYAVSVTGAEGLSEPITVPLSVTGSATFPGDYTVLTQDNGTTIPPSVTFTPPAGGFGAGPLAYTFTVTPVAGATVEPDEYVAVSLGGTSGDDYTLGTATAQMTIVNDDLPSVSIASSASSVAEDSGTPVTFTVTLSGAAGSSVPVDVPLVVAANGATFPGDYTVLTQDGDTTIPASVTFTPPPGEVFGAGPQKYTFTVTPVADQTVEPDEAVAVSLGAGSGQNYMLGTSTATTTFIDDDNDGGTPSPLPIVTVTASVPNASEIGPTSGQFLVTRVGGDQTSPLTVSYTVNASSTAKPTDDYQPLMGTVAIGANASSAIITVNPVADTEPESKESVVIDLASSAGYAFGTFTHATVYIADNAAAAIPHVTIKAANPTATETGQTAAIFEVDRTGGDLSQPLTVTYTVKSTSTASPSNDYQPLSGSVMIAANQSRATFRVVPVDDAMQETDETVVVDLNSSSASPATYTVISPSSATVSIIDNDSGQSGPTHITLSATQPNASESGPISGEFTVTRTGPTSRDITVLYALDPQLSTAYSGMDFIPLSGTVIIRAGSSGATFKLTPIDDASPEQLEMAVVNLAYSNDYLTTSANTATVMIHDNDATHVGGGGADGGDAGGDREDGSSGGDTGNSDTGGDPNDIGTPVGDGGDGHVVVDPSDDRNGNGLPDEYDFYDDFDPITRGSGYGAPFGPHGEVTYDFDHPLLTPQPYIFSSDNSIDAQFVDISDYRSSMIGDLEYKNYDDTIVNGLSVYDTDQDVQVYNSRVLTVQVNTEIDFKSPSKSVSFDLLSLGNYSTTNSNGVDDRGRVTIVITGSDGSVYERQWNSNNVIYQENPSGLRLTMDHVTIAGIGDTESITKIVLSRDEINPGTPVFLDNLILTPIMKTVLNVAGIDQVNIPFSPQSNEGYGAIVALNSDDSDNNHIADLNQKDAVRPVDNSLVAMQLVVPLNVRNGIVRLVFDGGNNVRVWTQSNRSGDLVLKEGHHEATWTLGQQPTTLWIEGVKVGGFDFTLIVGRLNGSEPSDPGTYASIRTGQVITGSIKPDAAEIGKSGDIVPSVITNRFHLTHYVSPKKKDGKILFKFDPSQVPIIFDKSKLHWSGGTTDPSDPLSCFVKRDTAAPVRLQLLTSTGGVVAQLMVWIVWADGKAAINTFMPIVNQINAIVDQHTPSQIGSGAQVVGSNSTTWRATPVSIFTAVDRPDFSPATTNVPGTGSVHPITGVDLRYGGSKRIDVSQKVRAEILSPNISSAFFANGAGSQYSGLPSVLPVVEVDYPTDDLVGNDDVALYGHDDYRSNGQDNDPGNDGILHFDDLVRILTVRSDGAAINDTVEMRIQFKDFVRIEIGDKWYLMSDFVEWRILGKMRFASEAQDNRDYNNDGDKADEMFVDNGSIWAPDNVGW